MSAFSVNPLGGGAYAVAGELTFDTVPQALQQSRDWFVAGAGVAVDLAGVSRADSAGLAMLLEWRRAARRHGAQVAFRHVPTQILAIARLTSLEPVLKLIPDEV